MDSLFMLLPPALNTANSSSLTVRYGTRLPSAANHQNDGSQQLDFTPSVPKEDTCPNSTVFCDAVKDCQLGSNEANCGEEAHEHTRPRPKNKNTARKGKRQQ